MLQIQGIYKSFGDQELFHDAGCLIEGAVVPERDEFMAIARQEGLKAAIAWRDARFSDD